MLIHPATIAEIIIFLLFLIVILRFLRRKPEELLTFVLPIILLMAFIEAMAVEAGKFIYHLEGFHIIILHTPFAILLAYVVGVYIAFYLTDTLFYRFSFLKVLLNVADSIIFTVITLVIGPLGLKLGWWDFFSPSNYLIEGYFLGVPLWEFFGIFLLIFLFSFGYRRLKKFNFKKRAIFTYSYIVLILIVRFLVYLTASKLQLSILNNIKLFNLCHLN